MSTVAEHVPFLDLCRVCEKVASKKGKDKHKPIEDFIQHWRDFHLKLHEKNPQTTDSFYPALRLLLPQCERERAAYGIKEHTLGKLYTSVLCLDKNSMDAQKLMNYRSPKTAKAEAGDFAAVAYFILKKRCTGNSTLKVHDVNQYLDDLANYNATKNKDGVKTTLQRLVMNMSALEQKWLIRMILKDMKMGISENTVLNAYHTDAKDVYNVTNSLEKVCVQLKDPNVRLHEIEISLFMPFRPMLGEQALPNQVEKILKNEPFVIEPKFDGERLQLHKRGNQYKYFSRNAHEVTHVYGANPLEGKLTPYIASAFKPHIRDCILDGEIVIYSNKLNCIVSKGENADVQALEPEGDYHPCFCAFDVLLVNGRVLSNLPFMERVSHLKNVLTPIENKIRFAEQKNASTNQEVADALNVAIDNHEEGIVVKSIQSTYRPNARKGGGWLKVKPDYIDNLMDELDLLIIGGYFGEGKRSNMISHFLLGVAEAPATPGDHPKSFQTVAKVGSGYTAEELGELLTKLVSHWQVFNPKKPPAHIVIGGGRKERPEVWLDPSKSHIVQVRAAEIVRSDRFATNCTLRFPRVQKIRYDKSWYDCMTTSELESLRQQSEGRLANHYELPQNEEPSPKKPRRAPPRHAVTVAPQFRPSDLDDVEQISDFLQGKEFCVLSTSLENKKFLEKAVAQHGGKCVQNPGPSTFCILADRVTLKVRNVIQTNQYDVVKESWLKTCIEEKKLIPWTPDDMFHSAPETLAELRQHFDEFGDSYTKDVMEETLKKIFDNMPQKAWEKKLLTTQEIADLEFRYFSSSSPYGLFRTCCAYIDRDDVHREVLPDLKLVESKLRLYGADVRSDIDEDVTHAIVDSNDLSRFEEMKRSSRTRRSGRFHIVTKKWVERSIRHGNMQPERGFYPVKG